MLECISEALSHPGVRKRFLDAWREVAGWPASYRRANARLSQWLDPSDPHRFPAEALPTLIRACGHARFIDGLLAVEATMQREQRANAERFGPMRSVRPQARERRESA